MQYKNNIETTRIATVTAAAAAVDASKTVARRNHRCCCRHHRQAIELTLTRIWCSRCMTVMMYI